MYLVTGGAGFCGVEIVKTLIGHSQTVRVLDCEPFPESIPGLEFVQADVRDKTAVAKACQGIEKVIHTVAKVPISKAGKEFWHVNVEGTRNVLEASLKAGVSKFVHLSSSAVQLSEHNPVDEYAPYHPVGEYARSKMEGEKVCREYIARGLDVDIIRPRTVVGVGRLGIFDILFDWISAGKNIYIIGTGKNKIQFLHSQDLADCCYRASLRKGPEVYNIGSKGFLTLREDLQALIKHAGSPSAIISLPVTPTILALSFLDVLRLSPLASWHYLTYHKDFYFDNKRALDILGWQPQYSNAEILAVAFDSYIERKGDKTMFGTTHRKSLKQGILGIVRRIS